MARTVRFTGCVCCGSSSSGSGSASGSGSGGGSWSDSCAGWYCCPESGEIAYIANCEQRATLGARCCALSTSVSATERCPNGLPRSLLATYSSCPTRVCADGMSFLLPWRGRSNVPGSTEQYWAATDPTALRPCVDLTPAFYYDCATGAWHNDSGVGGTPGTVISDDPLTVEFADTGTACSITLTDGGGGVISGIGVDATGAQVNVCGPEYLSGPYATEAEARAACGSSNSSSITTCCCPGTSYPSTFAGYGQAVLLGDPAVALTFTYDAGGALGAGWYSTSFRSCLRPGEPTECCADYSFFYRCVENPTSHACAFALGLVVSGAIVQEFSPTSMTDANGVKWTGNGPTTPCGDEFLGWVQSGIDWNCDGNLLMAANPFAGDDPAVTAQPDRYALPLCRYEGAALEYATCGCEGKHVRNCDNPHQGGTDPQGRAVPEIDRCQREYQPMSTLQSCERCPYRVAPEEAA